MNWKPVYMAILPENLDRLVTEYRDWLIANKIDSALSADDLLMDGYYGPHRIKLTGEERAWLMRYIERWDRAESGTRVA